MYERKERSGLLEENANKGAREGGREEKTRVYYTTLIHTHTHTIFFEKVFKEKLLRPDRNVSFAEMDGAPVRFLFPSFYRCIMPPLSTTSGLATRRCRPRALLLSLSLFKRSSNYARRGARRFVTRRHDSVPIHIEQLHESSLFLSLEIKGARSLSLSSLASLIIETKKIKVENRDENQ